MRINFFRQQNFFGSEHESHYKESASCVAPYHPNRAHQTLGAGTSLNSLWTKSRIFLYDVL